MAPRDPVEELENLDLEDEGDQNQDPVDEEVQDNPVDEDSGDRDDQVDVSPQPEPAQERQPSRRDTRIQSLIEEGRRKDADYATLRQRMDEIERKTAQPQAPRESEAERAARLATMTTPEVIAETLRESEARFTQRLNTVASQTADQADRAAFKAKATSIPQRARYQDPVETRLAELRRQGINLDRDVLLKYIVGEKIVDSWDSPKENRTVNDAARRVQARRGRPSNPGSDTARTGRNERDDAAARVRRLENMQI